MLGLVLVTGAILGFCKLSIQAWEAHKERELGWGGAYLFYGYLGLVLAGALVIIGANYLGYDFLM